MVQYTTINTIKYRKLNGQIIIFIEFPLYYLNCIITLVDHLQPICNKNLKFSKNYYYLNWHLVNDFYSWWKLQHNSLMTLPMNENFQWIYFQRVWEEKGLETQQNHWIVKSLIEKFHWKVKSLIGWSRGSQQRLNWRQ